ncbi:hypothetical protein [Proteiniclasticum ruminis]|uniref:hypothetical protein n=1 Tax=Proteiniclasticum ruminis TaxID=398199 RepID=UPI0028AAEAD9|nr:hypothetical protein [Proteiniclasticum ruminis]
MINNDILINQLFNDRRDGVSLSIISPEGWFKKVVKPDFMDKFFDEDSPESEVGFPPLKSPDDSII